MTAKMRFYDGIVNDSTRPYFVVMNFAIDATLFMGPTSLPIYGTVDQLRMILRYPKAYNRVFSSMEVNR